MKVTLCAAQPLTPASNAHPEISSLCQILQRLTLHAHSPTLGLQLVLSTREDVEFLPSCPFSSSFLQISDPSAALSSDLHLFSSTDHLSTWVFLPWTGGRKVLSSESLGKYEVPYLKNLSLTIVQCLKTVLLNILFSFVVVMVGGRAWYHLLLSWLEA